MQEKIIQHKGQRGDILKDPNSLEAVLENYQGRIEIDLILLKDGTLAALHERDFNLSLEEAENLTRDDIEQRSIRNIYPFDRKQMIPLASEVAGLSADIDAQLYLEIKASNQEKAAVLAVRTVQEVCDMDKEQGFRYNPDFIKKRLQLQSFSAKALRLAKSEGKKYGQEISTGLFWPSDEEWARRVPLFDFDELDEVASEKISWHEKGVAVAKKNKFEVIEYQPFVIDKGLVDYVHNQGLKIGSSIMRDQDRTEELIKMGVDYVKSEH